MAMGRVWAGFLYTRTRPADQDSQPEPGPIINRIFFWGPNPPRRAPAENHTPRNQNNPKITNNRIYM